MSTAAECVAVSLLGWEWDEGVLYNPEGVFVGQPTVDWSFADGVLKAMTSAGWEMDLSSRPSSLETYQAEFFKTDDNLHVTVQGEVMRSRNAAEAIVLAAWSALQRTVNPQS